MDEMIEQSEFNSFRPSIARAIAQARDEKLLADHPIDLAFRGVLCVGWGCPRLVVVLDLYDGILARVTVEDVARGAHEELKIQSNTRTKDPE